MQEEFGEKIRPSLYLIWEELIENATLEQKVNEGALHFRNGVTQYSHWSDNMVHKYGDRIRFQLNFIWGEIQKANTIKQPNIYCPYCDKELMDEQINFCHFCGKDLIKFKKPVHSNQNNIPNKTNALTVKPSLFILFNNFLRAKYQLIRKSSLNDWLDYIWKHILQIIIIILLLILVANQCDSFRNILNRKPSGRTY